MTSTAGAPAGVTIPPAAEPAWRAYLAMLESKDAHFAALEAINRAREQGRQPSLAETAHVAGLLERHDACVAGFRDAMTALEDADRRLLAQALALLNRDLGNAAPDA